MPEASVIVCTYNRRAYLERCLESLLAQDYPSADYEIIIVDNNSSDDTMRAIQSLAAGRNEPMVAVYSVPEQGLSRARNRGVQMARGSLILFIDDDALAAPDWVSVMTASLADSSADAVAGRVDLRFPQQKPPWMTRRFHSWLSEFCPVNDGFQEVTGPPWPVGCNMAFRAACFGRIGSFNPELGRKGQALYGGEEVDFFARLIKAGGRLFIQPKAVVEHLVQPERMRRGYFVRLNEKLGEQRVNGLNGLGYVARLAYFFKFFIEICANFLVYLFVISITLSSDRSFLSYLFLRRSLVKMRTLIWGSKTD